MRVLYFFCLGLLALAACKNAGTTQSDTTGATPTDAKTLEDRVMAIHDEVMPKMNDIGHLSAQLRRIKAGLQETPEGKIESPEGLEDALENLKLAEQGMWDWMKSYSDTKATLHEDQLVPFFQSEMEKVTKVKTDILAAIENAQAWIAANAPVQQ